MLPLGNSTTVAAERALHSIVFFFNVLVRFLQGHPLLLSVVTGSGFLAIRLWFVIGLQDKRAAVLTVLAEIHLADVPPGDREDIAAFTDRTI